MSHNTGTSLGCMRPGHYKFPPVRGQYGQMIAEARQPGPNCHSDFSQIKVRVNGVSWVAWNVSVFVCCVLRASEYTFLSCGTRPPGLRVGKSFLSLTYFLIDMYLCAFFSGVILTQTDACLDSSCLFSGDSFMTLPPSTKSST